MTYGSGLLGHTYKLKGGTPFTVLGVEGYPNTDIKKQYQPQLVGLEKDQLVAVPYRTTLIPNITMGDGVARIVAKRDMPVKKHLSVSQLSVPLLVLDRPGLPRLIQVSLEENLEMMEVHE